jgi:hypothetical protein
MSSPLSFRVWVTMLAVGSTLPGFAGCALNPSARPGPSTSLPAPATLRSPAEDHSTQTRGRPRYLRKNEGVWVEVSLPTSQGRHGLNVARKACEAYLAKTGRVGWVNKGSVSNGFLWVLFYVPEEIPGTFTLGSTSVFYDQQQQRVVAETVVP